MLKIYFTKNNDEWSNEKLAKMLMPLPESLRHRILAYKGWQDRQSRILGKWLLLQLIDHFKLRLNLSDIKYTEFNKPYFSNLNFSTAHSGDLVICASCLDSEIGLDIERIVPIHLENYQEQLTKNEWAFIQNSPDPEYTFYQIWTKKEALLKAIGRGIDIDFASLDVCGETIHYDGKNYCFYPLSIENNYVAFLATSAPFYSESISSEMLSDLP